MTVQGTPREQRYESTPAMDSLELLYHCGWRTTAVAKRTFQSTRKPRSIGAGVPKALRSEETGRERLDSLPLKAQRSAALPLQA